MKKEPLLKLLYRYSVTLFSRLMVIAGIIVFIVLFFVRDLKFRKELRDVLTEATAELSHLFIAYDATDDYTATEIFELTCDEIQEMLLSSPGVFLQVINTREMIYYDSRTLEISKKFEFDRSDVTSPFEKLRNGGLAVYVDRDLTGNEVWILRAGVTWKTYLTGHFINILIVIPLCSVLIIAFQALGEVYRRRRFDNLVSAMVRIMRHTDEATLINAVPNIVARMLDFDAVGLYLRDGDSIIPKAAYLPGGDIQEFLRSTDAEPITVNSDYPEARAVRENTSILVDPRFEENVHKKNLAVAGRHPYVITVMKSEEGGSPIGLLTAQYHRGLQPEHQDFLASAAQLVALLIEKFRSKDSQERMYRQMIRNTRTMSIGTVVPFVAHNMKTPLVIIAQLAKSIRNDLDGLDQERARETLDQVRMQVDLCFDLLQNISRYNKLGNSADGTVRIQEGLDKVCAFFRDYLRIKGITLEQDYAGKFPPGLVIEIEEIDFIQVITNLLINADEALAETIEESDLLRNDGGDRIAVQAASCEDDSRITITIEDNGPGISPEVLSKIFEEDVTTKEFGTGVGLPYCRRVIEQAGGELTVKSSLGRGASFSIALPRIDEHLSKTAQGEKAID